MSRSAVAVGVVVGVGLGFMGGHEAQRGTVVHDYVARLYHEHTDPVPPHQEANTSDSAAVAGSLATAATVAVQEAPPVAPQTTPLPATEAATPPKTQVVVTRPKRPFTLGCSAKDYIPFTADGTSSLVDAIFKAEPKAHVTDENPGVTIKNLPPELISPYAAAVAKLSKVAIPDPSKLQSGKYKGPANCVLTDPNTGITYKILTYSSPPVSGGSGVPSK